MSHIEAEVASQPMCWRAAEDIARRESSRLPQPGERVAAVGCGTSLYMARAYAHLREAAGHGETDAYPASEFRSGRSYDRVIALSRSGTTTEVVDLVEALPDSIPTLAITAEAGTAIERVADDTLILDVAFERSVVQTRFPTTLLAVFRSSLGESLTSTIADAERALRAPLPAPVESSQVTFLGTGWVSAIADEAALKCREAAGAWTESYPAMEYRHGPISVSGPRTVVWIFGEAPDGLVADAGSTGATVVTSDLDPMADLIRAQRFAVALAERAGRDPDQPLHLAFSVILG